MGIIGLGCAVVVRTDAWSGISHSGCFHVQWHRTHLHLPGLLQQVDVDVLGSTSHHQHRWFSCDLPLWKSDLSMLARGNESAILLQPVLRET